MRSYNVNKNEKRTFRSVDGINGLSGRGCRIFNMLPPKLLEVHKNTCCDTNTERKKGNENKANNSGRVKVFTTDWMNILHTQKSPWFPLNAAEQIILKNAKCPSYVYIPHWHSGNGNNKKNKWNRRLTLKFFCLKASFKLWFAPEKDTTNSFIDIGHLTVCHRNFVYLEQFACSKRLSITGK